MSELSWANMFDGRVVTPAERKVNNPNNEPTGHYTGRCMKCGSSDLWDDCTAYGCNACGAVFFTG